MDDTDSGETFGCERCWPSSADAAWRSRQTLTCEADLIDESHFHAMILACPECAQRFVSVFTETIDWADGDDPQYWVVLPITEAETADLARRRGSPTESKLHSLGPGRRCLRRDHPKGEAPSCFWGADIFVHWHD
jgi:hypothetical protein